MQLYFQVMHSFYQKHRFNKISKRMHKYSIFPYSRNRSKDRAIFLFQKGRDYFKLAVNKFIFITN